jgi:ribosomal protein S21
MSNENDTNHLKRFKRKNLKKAGQLDETKGSKHLEKFINRNRKAAGLEQK